MQDRLPSESFKPPKFPNQRWQISPASDNATQLGSALALSPLLAQVLINRGIETVEQAQVYLHPESQTLPLPMDEFPDLCICVDLLMEAITTGAKIAICGDYDADGMTSTALLLRALRWLGAEVDYAIPSRMKDGYGINQRIVDEFYAEGVQLILTVDNGISAVEAIAYAIDLGINVIITDHHDLPEELPPADAILNPKLIPETSPYRGLAGVGVAYILAVTLAQELGQVKGLTTQLLELFTLGTIADLAPLTGVNRRWLKRGLRLLSHSEILGIQALIQVSGIKQDSDSEKLLEESPKGKSLKPDDIGFKLGPRINAIGRIGDPQIVIELLTTTDVEKAKQRATQCEQINRERQELCEQIGQEAITWIEESQINLQQERVLVIVQPGWHHGVIGIVASRLVERYGVPVFIGTYEEDEPEKIRGSARGIPEFNVFEALQYCKDLLGKFGGHKAAGGFSFPADNLEAIQSKLSQFAHQCLKPEYLKPLVKIDALANFNQINHTLYKQIDVLHPCGIENSEPIFYTANVRIVEQKIVGKDHIKLTVAQDNKPGNIKAIAWRWGDYFPLPSRLDIAYKLRENIYNGNTNIELELVGVRLPQMPETPTNSKLSEFDYNQRHYTCGFYPGELLDELRIKNPDGKVLAIKRGQRIGLLGRSRQDAKEVDVTKPPYSQLIKAARHALGIN